MKHNVERKIRNSGWSRRPYKEVRRRVRKMLEKELKIKFTK